MRESRSPMNGAPMNGASARLLATLALALGLVLLTLGRAHLSADIADFLPQGESEGARFMLDQVRRGPAASLLLFGIEGAPAADLAAISRDFAARLRASGQFRLVQNGAGLAGGEEQDFLFRHRYPLSPATSADAFTEAALHADFSALLTALASSAAPLATEFGLADPTGAFPALLALWAGPSQVREIGGVWFAPERDRALLIARTRASGVDLAGQHAAARAVAAGDCDRAIVLGGSGTGEAIVANKIPGIRCVEASDPVVAHLGRLHNDCNALSMGGRIVGAEVARACVSEFLSTLFEGGRHVPRIAKIRALEDEARGAR